MNLLKKLRIDDDRLLEAEIGYIKAIEKFLLCKQSRYTEEKNLDYVKMEIQKAWKSKNYMKLIEIADPVYNKLPDSFQMKYKYAKKRLS